MERKVVYMCPCCDEIIGIKKKDNVAEYNYTVQDLYRDYDIDSDLIGVDCKVDLPLLYISCRCNKCGKDVRLIELDEGISYAVQQLRKKGYYTLFSCEGHIIDTENFDYAYIIFDIPSRCDDIFMLYNVYNIFPTMCWTINRKVLETYRDGSTVEIYMKNNFAKDEVKRKEALKLLNIFVDKLPNIEDEDENNKAVKSLSECELVYMDKDTTEEALEKIEKIRKIIDIDNSIIQEDVLKYKMICEIMKNK